MTAMLVLTLLRQRLTSPMRVLFVCVLALVTVGAVVMTQSLTPFAQLGPTLAIVFAAGLIGQELSSGTLQLALARPITRRRYVLARWLGAVLGVAGVALALLGAGLTGMAMRGAPLPSAAIVGVTFLQIVLDGAAVAAVIAALSAALGGLGDLAILLLLYTLLPIQEQVARAAGWTRVLKAVEIVQPLVSPRFDLGFLLTRGTPHWSGLANGAGMTVLGLALAITLLNRREISYGNR